MYSLNENILFRTEFFGGVLISKNNFRRIELNKSETIFLKALELVGDLEIAKKIHDSIIETKQYDIDKFINLSIIKEETNNVKKIYDVKESISILKYEINEIFKLNFLSAPLEITIYPTLKCNANCKFCFIKNKNCDKISIKEINSKEWLKLIKEAKNLGILSLSILGGEPFLYYEIDELLKGIEDLGILTTITSNGTYLKESTKQILLKSKFITPVISLQALNEKHKQLTGIEYNKPLEIIKYFLNNNKSVRINSVYTIQTLNDFYELIDFVAINRIDRYSIATYVKTNDNNEINEFKTLLDSKILDDNIKKYIKKEYKNKKINYSLEGCLLYSAYPELMSQITNLSEFDKLYYGCRAGKSKLEIYSNGDVYPCICFENIINPISNILNSNLKEIWMKDYYFNKLRNEHSKNETCLLCGFNEFCNGGCPAFKNKLYGDNYIDCKDDTCLITKESILGI